MIVATPDRLFSVDEIPEVEDIVDTEFKLTRGFLAKELEDVDIWSEDVDEQHNIFILHEMLAIAAEGLARTIARQRGIDPELVDFDSDLIGPRINADNSVAPFIFDLNFYFREFNGVNAAMIEKLLQHAFTLAVALVEEVRQTAATIAHEMGGRAVWGSQELLAQIAPIIEEELRAQGISPDNSEYEARYRTAQACMERLMGQAISMSRQIDNDTRLKVKKELAEISGGAEAMAN